MPDFFEIIGTTRSMRRLKPDPVPDELIKKILEAGTAAANGGNTQKWRFLVVKDPAIKKAVQVWYKKAFDEVVGPRYATSAPPPGVSPDRYGRQHGAVEYLTEHFHEAPVWIVPCASGTRNTGSSIFPAVQNILLACRALQTHDAFFFELPDTRIARETVVHDGCYHQREKHGDQQSPDDRDGQRLEHLRARSQG